MPRSELELFGSAVSDVANKVGGPLANAWAILTGTQQRAPVIRQKRKRRSRKRDCYDAGQQLQGGSVTVIINNIN